MRLSGVLSRYDLPDPELQAARLDGELFALDECFCPIDELEQTHHRAASLSLLIPARVIAEQHSAAWVYGAIPFAPPVHEVCVDTRARQRPVPLSRLLVREVVIDPADVFIVDGLRVTTPLRTILDLARFSDSFGDDEACIVIELMRVARIATADCEEALNRRRNLPGKRRALQRLGGVPSSV